MALAKVFSPELYKISSTTLIYLCTFVTEKLLKCKRLRILPAPANLGRFPVEVIWHVRYRHDLAHTSAVVLFFKAVLWQRFVVINSSETKLRPERPFQRNFPFLRIHQIYFLELQGWLENKDSHLFSARNRERFCILDKNSCQRGSSVFMLKLYATIEFCITRYLEPGYFRSVLESSCSTVKSVNS